ncbi:single-stranded DNA-binding protein [Fusibacter tunisiensis]|jgi:single-strand DNA-binding protein|uniref:Single-stranded DNA-binding protein n=1 Tax=Fusibacter tunisiensis TaxID=1008308 RepID=A0ABS2MTV3_9FIRM|nr:single-stranded DNA-binding protein [Fusibacter tunisiensis]MBM7562697.1 single-strand DNA-binding protein [Fusibacter tunisiensis]
MNQVSLVGRLTLTPELKTFQDGNCVTKFNLAVDRYLSGVQKEEKKSEGKATADFPRIIVWGKQAENCCKYLKKGSMTSVVGRVVTSSFENNEGDMVYMTEIVAERVQFLDPVSNTKEKGVIA